MEGMTDLIEVLMTGLIDSAVMTGSTGLASRGANARRDKLSRILSAQSH